MRVSKDLIWMETQGISQGPSPRRYFFKNHCEVLIAKTAKEELSVCTAHRAGDITVSEHSVLYTANQPTMATHLTAVLLFFLEP